MGDFKQSRTKVPNLTVSGDLTVEGDTTTISTTNTVVKDKLIELNNGATSNTKDCGIIIERGSTGDNAIFAWDESADSFIVGTTTATGASTAADLTITPTALNTGDITVGSGAAADTKIVFDGNAQDYRIGIDDGDDKLEIGHGTAHGTNTAIAIDSSGQVTKLSLAAAVVAVADDHIVILDGGATGAPKAESIQHLLSAIAGAGISVSGNQLVADGGGTADAVAADNISAGDAAINITTSSGNITIDAAANNTDIIFKGTDATSDITMLTLDGSEAGTATFNSAVVVGADLTIPGNIVHAGDTNNTIGFGTDTQDFQTGGSSRLDISDSGVRLGGANARVTTILDEDAMGTDSATALATQQSIKAYVDANKADMSFVLEDGDGTEVAITKDKEVKFVEGGGIDIDWTDVDNGTDGDPYDLTFTINAAQTGITSLLATDIKIGEDDQTKIDFETANAIHFYADNHNLIALTDANDGDAVLTVPTADKNFTIKGTDGSSAITALDIDMAAAGAATFNGVVTAAGFTIGSAAITEAELEIIDGATVTTTELNLIDGDTSRGTTAVANGDGFLHNDGGTMRMTNVSKLADLFAGTGITASNSVISVDAAQTGITSLLATDIKIGEDDQTKIDFETADEIHFYAANVEQVYLADNIFGPQSDSDVDLGTTGVRWKDAYIDTITTTGDILCSGEIKTANIGFTDGDNAMTIADGGAVTFPQAAAFTSGASFNDANITNVGDVSLDSISSDGALVTVNAPMEIAQGSSGGASALILDNDDTDQIALEVQAANIDADVIDITADAVTTANVIDITADGLTSGAALNITSTSTSTTAGSIVKIASTGDRGDDSNAVVGLEIDFDSTAGTATRAFKLNSAQTTGIVAEIFASTTTGAVLDIGCGSLTTGVGLNIISNSANLNDGSLLNVAWEGNNTNVQSLAVIHNDNVNSTGTTPLQIKQDSTGPILDATYGENGAGIALKMKEVDINISASSTTTSTASSFFPALAVPIAMQILVTSNIENGKHIIKLGTTSNVGLFANTGGSDLGDGVLDEINDNLTLALNAGSEAFGNGASGIGAAQNLVITHGSDPNAGAVRATLWYYQLAVDTSG